MGTFYGNVLVARPCAEAVPLPAGEGVTGYALPVGPGHTVVHPDPDTSALDLAAGLGRLLAAPAVGTYVFDSDVLVMLVHEDGVLRLDYDSCPGYFDKPETDENGNPLVPVDDFGFPAPVGVDPDAFLPLAAGPVDRAALESALRGTPLDPEDGEDGRHVFADVQHYDVMACLGLHAPRLTTGFHYLAGGDLPYGTAAEDLVVLGGAVRPTRVG
ncbi:hypothetical protein NFX46_37970 [Streptomyces phaeoluteigriseus]|uniref:DUF4241 domain-containing protein n=1 Tax=Streptomyces phaeoluteigriseus TaxID=114686 RepID=A0ABY4ZKZ2_9ACTN|nr:hypothetical protein [Streptomyces phaeoluteigriseus]USQ89028.1 hypothetical protein NFX46_37970 [Streptomyces phaeoluteigriseus]